MLRWRLFVAVIDHVPGKQLHAVQKKISSIVRHGAVGNRCSHAGKPNRSIAWTNHNSFVPLFDAWWAELVRVTAGATPYLTLQGKLLCYRFSAGSGSTWK